MAALAIAAGGEQAFVVDGCKRCRVLWLDAGEREQLRRESLPALDEDEMRKLALRGRLTFASWVMSEQRRISAVAAAPKSAPHRWLGYLGFPVVQGAGEVSVVPLITWVLVGLMALGLWLVHESEQIATLLGFAPTAPWRLGGATVLTSVMLHAGVLHFLGNAYVLLVCGGHVEQLLGHVRVVMLLVLAAVSSCGVHALVAPGEGVLVGASGVISALLVFFALALPHARVTLFAWLPGRSYFGHELRWIGIPMHVALALWVASQLVGVVKQAAGVGHVSYAAHLGGAMSGAVAYAWWQWPVWKAARRHAADESPR